MRENLYTLGLSIHPIKVYAHVDNNDKNEKIWKHGLDMIIMMIIQDITALFYFRARYMRYAVVFMLLFTIKILLYYN
jgi:hypothetical protein